MLQRSAPKGNAQQLGDWRYTREIQNCRHSRGKPTTPRQGLRGRGTNLDADGRFTVIDGLFGSSQRVPDTLPCFQEF